MSVSPSLGVSNLANASASGFIPEQNIHHPEFLGRYGAHLARLGWIFTPIRAADKRPILKAWNTATEPPEPVTIANWIAQRPLAGIGILTRNVVAIDIDYEDAALANDIERLASDVLGETEFIRIGRAPKRLLVYRAADAITGAKVGKVDILGRTSAGKAQQFVAFAVHSKTGKPYEWSERSPLDCAPSALPAVTAADVDLFKSELAALLTARGIVVNATAVRGAAPAPTFLAPAASVADLPIEPMTRLDNAVRRAIALLRRPAGHTNEAVYGAFADVSRVLHSFRFESNGTVLDHVELSARVGNELFDAALKAVAALPDWSHDRVDAHATRGWQRGSLERIPSGPVQPTASQTGSVWKDRFGVASADVFPTQQAAPVPPSFAIEDLRQRVSANISAFFDKADEFHKRTARGWHVEGAEAANATHRGVFLTRSLRQINREQVGSAKTSAFVTAMTAFSLRPDASAWNHLYVARDTRMAKQTAVDLARNGVDAVVLQGAEKLCVSVDNKPTITDHIRAGLPIRDVCAACDRRSECKYVAQRKPVNGKVVIVQQQHVLTDNMPLLDEGSAPIFATTIDESIMGAARMVTSAAWATMAHRIKLPEPGKRRTTVDEALEERIKRIGAERANIEHDVAVVVDKITSAMRSLNVTSTPEFGRSERYAFDRAAFSYFLDFKPGSIDTSLSTPVIGEPLVHEAIRSFVSARRVFMGEVYAMARAARSKREKLSIRGRAAHLVALLNHYLNVLYVLVDNIEPAGGTPTSTIRGLCLDVSRTATGAVIRKIVAGRTLPLPARIKAAPVLLLDATGTRAHLEQLLRETGRAPRPTVPAGETVLADCDVWQPVWFEHEGRALAPYARKIRVVGAPVAASRLTGAAAPVGLRAGDVSINGETLSGGVKRARAASKIDFAAFQRPGASNAIAVKRFAEIVLAGAQRPAVIAPKAFRDGLEAQGWRENVLLGHHGAIAGLNDYAKSDVMVVIGQARPSEAAVIGAALCAASADPRRPEISLAGGERALRPLVVGGKTWLLNTWGFADPFVAEVFAGIQDAQQEQAYGRLRMTNRASATDGCTLIAVDDTTAGEWDEVWAWQPPSAVDVFFARHKRVPSSAAEAVRMAPDLFGTPRTAQRALVAENSLSHFATLALKRTSELTPLYLYMANDAKWDKPPEPTIFDLLNAPVVDAPQAPLARITAWDYYRFRLDAPTVREAAKRLSELAGVPISKSAVARHDAMMARLLNEPAPVDDDDAPEVDMGDPED
jgi:hypothetical protein